MALLRAITTLGSWTMASRVLGFVRDMLFAGVIGAGLVADAFFVAFKFPNFFRRLFAEGAFNAAFVPLFTDRLTKDGVAPARAFAAQVASIMVCFMLALLLIAQMAMPWLMHVIAPGFAEQPEKFALTIDLTRLTFPYLLFMALTALLAGMLNAMHRFAATAAAPVILNIVMITVLLLVRADMLPVPGLALAWGVSIAGAGQFLWLVFAAKRAGVMVRLPRPRLTPGVRRLLVLMVPGMIGAGVVQVNLVIDVVLASLLPQGSVSWLYYADRINQLPLGVVGVAVGVALLPMLSRHLSAGEEEAASHTQNRAIEFALLLTVPAATAFIVMPDPIVRVLYESLPRLILNRSAFGDADSVAASGALAAFAAGLPAYVLIKALTPGFFARQDTATPVKIAVFAMVMNVVIAVVLMQFIAHVGIALATACSAWINTALLAVVLRRRGHLCFDERLRRRTPRLVLAALCMAGVLWALQEFLPQYFGGAPLERLAVLAILVSVGAAVFGVLALLFGVVRPADLRSALGRS